MKLTSIIFLSAVLCLVLFGCSKKDGSKEDSSSLGHSSDIYDTGSQFSPEMLESLSNLDETPNSSETSESISNSDKITQTIASLNQGMSQFMEISYEDNVFQMTPLSDSDMTTMLKEIAEDPNKNKTELEEFANTLEGFVSEIGQNIGGNYSLELLNPYNDRGSFFIMNDKKIEYPILTSR